MEPLPIRMVHDWSVCLMQQNDLTHRWKATATRGSDYRYGTGLDAEMALRNLSIDIGDDPLDYVKAFL